MTRKFQLHLLNDCLSSQFPIFAKKQHASLMYEQTKLCMNRLKQLLKIILKPEIMVEV